MHIYKIIFVNNAVTTCEVVQRRVDLNSDYSYDHIKGKLIYALVKANSKDEAIKKGEQIAKQFTDKTFGTDFIQ